MPRKRDGFVPIGDVAGAVELPGDRALTPAAPQTRHHFTRLDQINQLVDASEADADLGFMARLLALCSLPRTNPGDRLQYKRVNGPYTLVMFSSGETKLPYGNLPRLLLAWVCTEAVRTQSRELILGRSLADFMRSVGVYDDGGAVRRRLRDQMQRLFRSYVELSYEDAHGSRFVNSAIAKRGEFWWDIKHPGPVLAMGEQDRAWRGVLSRGYRQPYPARSEHSQEPQAVAARPRSISVAHLSDIRAQAPATAHVAADLPAVRRRPG